MTELKRCPFCGGEAQVEQTRAGEYELNSAGFLFSIRCKKCHATAPGASGNIALNLTKAGEFNIWHNDLPKSVDAWNRRRE